MGSNLERIEQSDFFLVLMSTAATKSRGVKEEISHAHYSSLNSASSVPRIIPLILNEGLVVPRKIVRAVRLQFREESYDSDLPLLLRTLGLEASPFEDVRELEVTSTRAYEFDAQREAVRYANSLITRNEEVSAHFRQLTSEARERVGVRFHIAPAQVVTQSEEVTRYVASNSPRVSLLQTFWIFLGVMQGYAQGYSISENIVMQIDSSQDREFSDVGDERVLVSDSLRLQFQGFRHIPADPPRLARR
jgi:hypothetical protein